MTGRLRPSARELAILESTLGRLTYEARVWGLGAMGDADTEQQAADAVTEAWTARYGSAPTLEERQAVQAIGAHEGQYGRGWSDHASPVTGYMTSMEGSNNWGAVQCTNCTPTDGVCCDGCGYWYDSHPTADGQSYYEQCFKRYPTPAAGADGILAILDHMPGVIAALPSGDLDEIAWQMRQAHYFEGFTTDPHEAAAQYAAALDGRAQATADALGEERAAYRKGGADANPQGYATTDNPDGGGSALARAASSWWPAVKIVGGTVVAVGTAVAIGKGVKAWRGKKRAALRSWVMRLS